jgi:hypothetical protein
MPPDPPGEPEKPARPSLSARVTAAADALLARQDTVSPIDILVMIGWLAPAHVDMWIQGRAPSIEEQMQVKLTRLLGVLRLLEDWATRRRLRAIESTPVARTTARPTLRFTRAGEGDLERVFRTGWVSPRVSAKKRERLERAANEPPELLVIQPRKPDWKCHRCGGSGDLLIMEPPGPSCLRCGGLGGLVFLPSGDALLTRRARAMSQQRAVVVRFSGARKRYERQGSMVEPEALAAAQSALAAERREG